MSPEARYLGEKGEISAVYRPADKQADLQIGAITSVHYLANGASTNGDFGLYRWEMGVQPSGAAPHFHRTISESFFILSGTVGVFNGERWFDATPDDFVHVPAGGSTAFGTSQENRHRSCFSSHPGRLARAISRRSQKSPRAAGCPRRSGRNFMRGTTSSWCRVIPMETRLLPMALCR